MPVKEAEATNSLADQGVDVFTMHVDGPKVVVETAAKRGKMVCGYHASQAKLAPNAYLTGAEWNWLTAYKTVIDAAQAGKPHPELPARRPEGRLREDVAVRPDGDRRGQEERRRREGEDDRRHLRHLRGRRGGLKDNKGATRHRRGQDDQADRRRAREDELPGRRRDRLGLRRVRIDCAALRDERSTSACRSARWPAALLLFGGFVWLGGASPVETWTLLFKGAFGDWFSWQNTLQRAAPLMLTALCVALPARAGLIIIGGEGALVLGGLAAAALPYAMPLPGNVVGTAMLCVAGVAVGAAWIALAGALRQYRGVNETISQPAARLHRDRALQAAGRRAAARPGDAEQAVDALARRGAAHRRHRRLRRPLGPRARRRRLRRPRPLAARSRRAASRCAWSAATRARRSSSACRRAG